jgi:predicted ribosome quality control (RQC) complex YloA/Tae2 family protein
MLLEKEIAKLEKQCTKLETQSGGIRNALWYNQIGDSLKAALHLVPEGTKEVSICNIYTRRPEIIPLNPKLSAEKNALLYYKKAKKARKQVAATLSETETMTRKLQKMRTALDTLTSLVLPSADPAVINSAVDEAASVLSELAPENMKTARLSAFPPYRHCRIGKWDIYVGKSESQNDELSIRFAAPTDLWFHVAGMAGSHVVLRRPKEMPQPHHKIIEAAASLAAWYSKARNAPYAEVHQTEARFVHKQKNAPAGEVIAERCTSLRVTPKSPERLKLLTEDFS